VRCGLLLPLAARYGLTELWITCNPDNFASRRTYGVAGVEFVEIVDLPELIDCTRKVNAAGAGMVNKP
jgi:tagatose 1,6-diphosphate aldolase